MSNTGLGADDPIMLGMEQYCRQLAIVNLEKKILFELEICHKLGWDEFEFINQLKDLLNSIEVKKSNGLNITERLKTLRGESDEPVL